MASNFEQCLEWLLEHEGGYVNHPKDPGGSTNKGITANAYEAWLGRGVSDEMIRNIPDDHVALIYRERYWDKIRADEIPSGPNWSMMDFAVNSGPSRSIRTVQAIVGAAADGIIGPQTLDMIEDQDPADLIDQIHDRRQIFYESLSTFDTFGRGWSRRNDETRQQALSLI